MTPRLASSAAPNPTTQGARAAALLGDTPTLTLIADSSTPDSCCTLRLVRHGAVWLGVVNDHSVFADRVRMGMVPRFVAGDASVHAVVGTARTRLLGRVTSASADVRRSLASVLGPWEVDGLLVVEIAPEELAVVVDELAGGPVPRT